MPDIRKKHTLAVGEYRFDLDSETQDLGETKVGTRTISSKSGVIVAILAVEVDNPQITTEYATPHIGPDASAVAAITTIHSISVA